MESFALIKGTIDIFINSESNGIVLLAQQNSIFVFFSCAWRLSNVLKLYT